MLETLIFFLSLSLLLGKKQVYFCLLPLIEQAVHQLCYLEPHKLSILSYFLID